MQRARNGLFIGFALCFALACGGDDSLSDGAVPPGPSCLDASIDVAGCSTNAGRDGGLDAGRDASSGPSSDAATGDAATTDGRDASETWSDGDAATGLDASSADAAAAPIDAAASDATTRDAATDDGGADAAAPMTPTCIMSTCRCNDTSPNCSTGTYRCGCYVAPTCEGSSCACGPLSCDRATEFCSMGGILGDTQYSCRPVPAACLDDLTCACARMRPPFQGGVSCTDIQGGSFYGYYDFGP